MNTQIYDGIKVGPGEKLSVEFEAQLPVARDALGNYVADVPLWPALCLGNDEISVHDLFIHCAEIDVMEWSPTKSPSGSASGYETQANVAYHWDGTTYGYNPYSTTIITTNRIFTLNSTNGELIYIHMMAQPIK